MFDFNRLIKTMVRFSCVNQQGNIQKIGINFLCNVSCEAKNRKVELGDVGVIHVIQKINILFL